jgi:hypothetical protein
MRRKYTKRDNRQSEVFSKIEKVNCYKDVLLMARNATFEALALNG